MTTINKITQRVAPKIIQQPLTYLEQQFSQRAENLAPEEYLKLVKYLRELKSSAKFIDIEA